MFKINARSAVLTGGVLAVLAAPVALGAGENQPLDGGTRNPSNNPRENYTRETEVIANVDTYGTRQSNKSNNGGGAVYGCRSGPRRRSRRLASGPGRRRWRPRRT